MEERMDRLEERMDHMEERMDRLEERMDHMEERMDRLEERMDHMEERMNSLEKQAEKMERRLGKIEIGQENSILPRLQNIEACYLSTYQRYCVNAGKMEAMEADIGILKQVVTDHSTKLQQIS